MSKAARTIYFWSFYLLGLGLIFLIVPNLLLGLFGFPATDEVWIRIVGMLLLILAYYCYEAARLEVTHFFRWSVNARASVIVLFTVLVLLKLALPQLILFGVVDLAAALWTRSTLQGE
jgi:hypothetical protein